MRYARFYRFLCMFAALIFVGFIFGQYLISGATPTLFSFGLVHFLGYLFFLIMPVEILVPVYLGYGFSPFIIVIIAIFTALLGLIIDYLIGLLFPSRILEDLVGEKRFDTYHKNLERYGKYVVLFFAATPLSTPLLTLVAGMVRFNYRIFFLYTAFGVMLKYAVLVALFSF